MLQWHPRLAVPVALIALLAALASVAGDLDWLTSFNW